MDGYKRRLLDMMADGLPPGKIAEEFGCSADAAAIMTCREKKTLRAYLLDAKF